MGVRSWMGYRLRKWADRIDWYGAPRATFMSFTFETGKGLVINDQDRGCRLWFLGYDDYEKARDVD